MNTPASPASVLFVTGTGTGVGKTVLTGLLLAHALRSGRSVRALKPFCSGDRNDALLLWNLQSRSMPLDEVNPWFFPQPLSPWTAARLAGRHICLDETIEHIRGQQRHCDLLLIEGAGGLLAPLGERFNALDLIERLNAQVLVVAANELGVLNQTLLTLRALARPASIALMNRDGNQVSTSTNAEDLRLLTAAPVVELPYLPGNLYEAECIERHSVSLSDELEKLLKKNPPDTMAEGTFFP